MGEGFLEKLTGCFADGTPVEELSPPSRLRRSIVDHLQRLLNTRQGMLIHNPSYGMPDVADLFRKLPGSTGELQANLERALRGFEPRLEFVRVSNLDFEPGSGKIRFRISAAVIGGDRLAMEAAFFHDGCGVVKTGN